MINLPKITVVTPSYNQGIFIEETIVSVISQGYANLEYIIIDGGSTDSTVEIIKKYEDKITYWVSEKDRGQGHAINKGFEIASGDIICWLNSDDMYMPGTLHHIASKINIEVEEIIYGNCLHFKQGESGVVSWGSNVVYASTTHNLEDIDYIIQPSSFWTRKAWNSVGKLNEDLNFAFDWEWFLRAKHSAVMMRALSKCLSMYRIHDSHKSGVGGTRRQQEILGLYKIYSPKLAELYESLCKENMSNNALERVVKSMLSIYGRPYSKADILRIVSYNRYKQFSGMQVENCLAML